MHEDLDENTYTVVALNAANGEEVTHSTHDTKDAAEHECRVCNEIASAHGVPVEYYIRHMSRATA